MTLLGVHDDGRILVEEGLTLGASVQELSAVFEEIARDLGELF